MLVRVFEIPPPTGNFHFGGGEPQTFVEVDWFRDDPELLGDDRPPPPSFATEAGRKVIADFLRRKHYFVPGRAYLVLHPVHPFTIGYSAP